MAKCSTDETMMAAAKELPDANEAERNLTKAGIMFVEVKNFMDMELKQPVWIVEDFISVGMKGDLCGGAKTKKTFLARQLAECIASGKCFVGAYRVSSPHKVAYVDLELFDWNSQERLRAQSRALDVDWDKYKGNLLICHLRGKGHILREHTDEIISCLKAKGIELVIIDPRYKLAQNGEDENTAEGLRGILEFRDTLAEYFAVLIVTHDPKGGNAQKKTTDRGAGSYTAGADFDYRMTIDKADNWSDEFQGFVIEAEGRARKPPPPVGVRFDGEKQIFVQDENVHTVKMDDGTIRRASNATRMAEKEAALQKAFKVAALKVVEDAGKNLLACERFDAKVAEIPGATVNINRRRAMRRVLVEEHTLAACPQFERKADGKVVKREHGCTLISTPDLIADYRRQFGV